MSISNLVTKLRERYHLEAIELNNVLNQLSIRSDNKAEDVAREHTMKLVNDIYPRLGYDMSILEEKKGPIKITINYKDGGTHEISANGRLSDIKIKEEESTYTSTLCIYIGDEAIAWYHAYDVKSILIES